MNPNSVNPVASTSATDSLAAFDAARAEESPLERIRGALPQLNGALRVCAEYVLSHAWEMRGRSIQEVAAATGVSHHAVNRFTRRIGYGGYREFSHALAMELGRIQGAAYGLPDSLTETLAEAPPASSDSLAVVTRVLAMELSALRNTVSSLDPESVRRSVRALSRAERILFIATGAAVGVSQTAAFRFNVFGIAATWAAEPGSMVAQIHLLRPGDVLFALSFYGTSQSLLEGVELARQRGVTTLCTTAVASSPISRLVDVPLLVLGHDDALAFGQSESRMATAAMLEALTSAVAWERRDAALAHATEVAQTNQRLHSIRSRSTRAPGRRVARRRSVEGTQ